MEPKTKPCGPYPGGFILAHSHQPLAPLTFFFEPRMAAELGKKLGQWNKERAANGKPPGAQPLVLPPLVGGVCPGLHGLYGGSSKCMVSSTNRTLLALGLTFKTSRVHHTKKDHDEKSPKKGRLRLVALDKVPGMGRPEPEATQ